MTDNSLEIRTALRVLSAIMEHCPPEARDVEELRRLAPLDPAIPVDELACEIVHHALTHRRRAACAGRTG
jgi:hypothetical protein